DTTYPNLVKGVIVQERKAYWKDFKTFYKRAIKRYELQGMMLEAGCSWMWKKEDALKALDNYQKYLEESKKTEESIEEYWERTGCELRFLRKEGNTIKYWIEPISKTPHNNWMDIEGYSRKWGYPTENSERLLERIIKVSSDKGDLVLDCYAGSGTTGAVAEKLGRKWIMVDSSKLAIYTMIKRMFNIREKIGNKGKSLKPNPFILYNAGLYENHGFILKMGEDNYKSFALELFQCEPKDFEINGLLMDGLLFNCPVKVFSQKGYLTEEYVDELHNTVGEYIKARMFIIAPASRVYFLQDYIDKKGIRYYALRIPYSVIDELHKTQFTRPMQPASPKQINQNIEQIGFDFIYPPQVTARYYVEQPPGKLFEEMVIEIKEFEAVQRAKEPVEFKDPKDALSMVLVDTDYNCQYFNMTHRFFAEEIKKAGCKVSIRNPKLGEKIMIVYIDIFGNERVEIKSIKDFKKH
ncbi:MAG: site-specific DNA-methyltransferase, partial [Methanosarcinales archaeon]|nr:site-specific DNA-methyltransferase [Methanosarcinales archaeon]